MNNQFALDLTRILHHPATNLAVSPLSLTWTLAMLFPGASEQIKTEMLDVLFRSNDSDKVDGRFVRKISDLLRQQKTLTNENYLYFRQDFEGNLEYFDMLRSEFGSLHVEQMNFSDPIKNVQEINQNIEQSSKGLIKKFLDHVDSETRLLLISLISFAAAWKKPFKIDQTETGSFRLSNGSTVPAELMSLNSGFDCFYSQKLQTATLRLDYINTSNSMIIMLPDQGNTVENLLDNLDQSSLKTIITALVDGQHFKEIDLKLPRFRLESRHERLIACLRSMGLKTIFSETDARFPGITGFPAPPMPVTDIIQQTVVKVDENGTEAIAATAIRLRQRSIRDEPKSFIVDRPFVFWILSDIHKDPLILFSGVVQNPNQN